MRLDLFLDAGGLAAAIAEVVQLRATHVATTLDLDAGDQRRVRLERTLDAFARRNLADDERRVQAAVADRDETASEALFGGKAMTLEEFTPNRAIVGTPDDCARELERIRELIDPEYLLFTPTGVPDAKQQMAELRLFGKEVLPHFRR